MSNPSWTCEVCGLSIDILPDGRGHPPDIARRKLIKLCKAKGHTCQPSYLAGVTVLNPWAQM